MSGGKKRVVCEFVWMNVCAVCLCVIVCLHECVCVVGTVHVRLTVQAFTVREHREGDLLTFSNSK